MKYTKTMVNEIILASKSGVRKKILEDNKITCRVEPSNVDEDSVKESLLKERASPTIISKNLAELKANKISQKFADEMVLGADSVIDFEGKIISKPSDRTEALDILKRINGKTHQLVSSVCISMGGSMIWNYTEKASLTMKNMTFLELENYLKKISDKDLYAYNVYQIEGEGRNLFSKIEGDEDTIMGLPVKKIEKEISDAKKTFTKYKWPTIDVTRKSVEETAASIIKIHEIYKNNG
jgi:septum formation protein